MIRPDDVSSGSRIVRNSPHLTYRRPDLRPSNKTPRPELTTRLLGAGGARIIHLRLSRTPFRAATAPSSSPRHRHGNRPSARRLRKSIPLRHRQSPQAEAEAAARLDERHGRLRPRAVRLRTRSKRSSSSSLKRRRAKAAVCLPRLSSRYGCRPRSATSAFRQAVHAVQLRSQVHRLGSGRGSSADARLHRAETGRDRNGSRFRLHRPLPCSAGRGCATNTPKAMRSTSCPSSSPTNVA